MTRQEGSIHVARVVRKYKTKSGEARESVSHLLRRSVRNGRHVEHLTLGNVSALPEDALEALRAVLAGKSLFVADEAVQIVRSLSHGHLAAVATMARSLGFPDILGPPCRQRDIAYGLVLARVVHPRTKLATLKWWGDTTLTADLGLEGVSTDEVYGGMDWLRARQDAIETTLARKHLATGPNPSGLAYFDLSSSWMEGTKCPLAARGYSRDHKAGKTQIEYGLLTDKAGRPVAIEVFPGNTADPSAFISIVASMRARFGIDALTMVGDRGMITTARIKALGELGGMGWLTCLRAPAIAALAAGAGPLQLSLFDEADLAEFTHPDYPNERLVACRNPLLATERARKRTELLAATEDSLAPIITAVAEGRLVGADRIGIRVGKVVNKHKMAKHFDLVISDTSLLVKRREADIAAEAALDGIYVLRSTLGSEQADAPALVNAYKALANVERDFRHIKIDDLALRPIHHRLEERVRAHVLICMLGAYLVWHLRQTLAPLTFTDECPPKRDSPVGPAQRSAQASAKAFTKTNADGEALRGFRDLLDHLGTLTRNTMAMSTGGPAHFELLSTPTPTQRRVFELLAAPVPLRLM